MRLAIEATFAQLIFRHGGKFWTENGRRVHHFNVFLTPCQGVHIKSI